jgi:hypothetical protein
MLTGDVDLHWGVSMSYCHVCPIIRIEMKVTKSYCHCRHGVILSVEYSLGACVLLAQLTPSHTSVYTCSVKRLFVN